LPSQKVGKIIIMENDKKYREVMIKKLNMAIELIGKLLIISGASMGIKKHDLRKIAGVGMSQVTNITRHIKSHKQSNNNKSRK